jgi:ABC-type dipeptide/oligopeptide/nickel transport system ATPase component
MFYISISGDMVESETVRRALHECDCAAGKYSSGLLEIIPKSDDSIEKLVAWRVYG